MKFVRVAAETVGGPIAATLLGVGVLAAMGAPPGFLATNVAACALGCLVFALVRLSPLPSPAKATLTIAAGAAVFATAFYGVTVAGATRWITLGPVSVQPGLVLAPALVVGLAGSRGDAAALIGMLLALAGLALQPDRGMTGAVAAALLVILMRRREPAVAVAACLATAAFLRTLSTPDNVPPSAFVEGVVASAFGHSLVIGLAASAALALLFAPALAAASNAAGIAFLAVWAGVIGASLIGPYPTPFVGAGASAIVGYFLSAAVLTRKPS